jgi:hypothetical protein
MVRLARAASSVARRKPEKSLPGDARMVHDDKNEEVPAGEKSVKETRQHLPTFYEPEGFSAVYSDNVVVMHTENEFILSFFQTDFPYPSDTVVDSKAGHFELSSGVSGTRARCVSRVIMSPNQMIKFVDALRGNLEKFLKRVERAKEAEEES